MVVNPNVAAVSAVSVEEDASASCNGVLVQIDASEIEKFDYREAGYTRVRIAVDRVTAATDTALPGLGGADIWCYVSKTPGGRPSDTFPILQTYVDVMILGCLEISLDFAKQFVTTTMHWNPAPVDFASNPKSYINDRHAPAYLRYDPIASTDAAAKTADGLVESLRQHNYVRRVPGPPST
jgi:hypothetical protein